MPNQVFIPGATAVVTGGAAGIGLAAASRFAELGLRVAIADLETMDLDMAAIERNYTRPPLKDFTKVASR